MFRGLSLNMESLQKFFHLPHGEPDGIVSCAGGFLVQRKTGRRPQARFGRGRKLIAVVRGNDVHANPEGAFCLKPGDILVLFGRHAPLNRSIRTLRSGTDESLES